MLLGDAILVPITEVGSVACAIGWAGSCASYLSMGRSGTLPGQSKLSAVEWLAAGFGLFVAIAMLLMKVIPAIPGHFTVYEWLALGVWIALGAISHRRSTDALRSWRFLRALRGRCPRILRQILKPESTRTRT